MVADGYAVQVVMARFGETVSECASFSGTFSVV